MSRPLEPGTILDGFRIEGLVHTGGMALLYRVTGGPEPGFPMLMKVPRLGPGEPATSVISFEIEETVLQAISGPHVPRFVAAGDLSRTPYLVMEQIEGRSLSEWAQRAPLEPEEVARLGAALATAVHALHVQEAIHLDLKPSNIIIRPDGQAVLIDFGLAHHAHYPDLLAEEFARPIGSAPYISPEQIVGLRSDPRSDLFALGAVLYELATGRLPFGSPSGERGLRARLHRDPIPPRALVPRLPGWLQEIVLRCLEVDARRRYPTAAQLAFALANPAEVAVGELGERLRTAGPLVRLHRWVKAAGYEPAPIPRPTDQLALASIVMVAVATHKLDAREADALREAVRRVLAMEGDARLACVTVIRPPSELGGSSEDDTATSQRIKHLVQLRHWAEPLRLEPARLSFHVLEAGDAAEALLRYARVNAVDHLVIGAPPREVPMKGMLGAVSTDVAPEASPEPLQLFRLVGTVSVKVALAAPCTVTVVRPRAVR
jgi:nucleotide-binding universal stress UspA family protein